MIDGAAAPEDLLGEGNPPAGCATSREHMRLCENLGGRWVCPVCVTTIIAGTAADHCATAPPSVDSERWRRSAASASNAAMNSVYAGDTPSAANSGA